MRPRQSSLGIVVFRPPTMRRTRFNEAEAIKPRNHGPGGEGRPADRGFNEAEAIKPRNPRIANERRLEDIGFNEAEAIKPRNP